VGEVAFSNDNEFLVCTGYTVDSIDGASCAYVAASGVYKELMLQPAQNSNQYGNGLPEALWQTLCLGSSSRRIKASLSNVPWLYETSSQSLLHALSDAAVSTPLDNQGAGWDYVHQTTFYERFHKFRKENETLLIGGRYLRDFFDKANTCCHEPERTAQTLKFVVLSLVGQRIIMSSTGYIRLSPESAQPGDILAILHGCKFPVVLRRHGNCYRVIGECYLHGFMDGEVLDMVKAGKYSVEKFKLC
jgi:hypothetical protein